MTSLLSATVPGFGVGLQVLCAWYGENTSIALLGMRVRGAAAAGTTGTGTAAGGTTETVSAASRPSRTAREGRRAERRDTGRDPQQRRQEGTRCWPGVE